MKDLIAALTQPAAKENALEHDRRRGLPCPVRDCRVEAAPGNLADHLVEWHGWTETEVAAWWGDR